MNGTSPGTPHQDFDLTSGMQYLNSLPLANPVQAEQQLMIFINSLLAAPPHPLDLLTLLEQARIPLCFVEEEMARRYHNKPLPLADKEDECFRQVVEAWRRMAKAYALCARLEEPDHADAEYVTMVATILHRCIYYTGMIILEHFRARRELPAGIWLDLHGYYETAEEWGVATIPVEDPLELERQSTHCAAAYVTLLLIDIVSPYSQSVRNLNLIRRWAGMWGALVSLHPVCDEIEIPPFVVELMRDCGLHPTPYESEMGPDTRRLDTSRLGLQINHMLSQLRQRVTPSQLGLGEDTAGHVIALLEQILRPWTQNAMPRKFRRFPTNGQARVCLGFEAIHFAVCGREFVQPDAASTYSRGEFDALFTFRQQVDPAQKLAIAPAVSFPTDSWEVINHSANGFRIARSGAGQKVSHGQLMAICPHDGDHFLLAQVSWLMQEKGGGLVAGVAVLPGMPVAIGIRAAAAVAARSEPYGRAFLMPPVPAIKEEGCLVVPAGTYSASKVMDVYSDSAWQVRLKNILHRGSDFERVSFESV